MAKKTMARKTMARKTVASTTRPGRDVPSNTGASSTATVAAPSGAVGSPREGSAVARSWVPSARAAWAWAVLLCLGGVAVRLFDLGRQGYWTDEQFILHASGGSWGHLWQAGRTEVHPPTFAALAKLWMELGGPGPSWMRLLPALFGCATIGVAWWGLRPLPRMERALMSAVLACSGMAITHSQDLRSYSLLLMCCTGLTAAMVRLAHAEVPRRRDQWGFVGWGVAASAVHLFGLVLALAGLVALRVRVRSRWLWSGMLLCALPQALWLVPGLLHTPGFAQGAQFRRPDVRAIGELLQASFGTGTPELLGDGFHYAQPTGALLVGSVLGIAMWNALRERREEADPLRPWTWGGGQAPRHLAVLIRLVVVTIAGSWLVAQWVHLWTLRNMVVLVPGITWSLVALVEWLGVGRLRERIHTALLVALTLCLAGSAIGLRHHYKTDFARAVDWYTGVRQQVPQAHVEGNISSAWWVGSQPDVEAPAPDGLLDDATYRSRDDFPHGIGPRPGTTVYLYYIGLGEDTGSLDRIVVNLAGGQDNCTSKELATIVAVRCDLPDTAAAGQP